MALTNAYLSQTPALGFSVAHSQATIAHSLAARAEHSPAAEATLEHHPEEEGPAMMPLATELPQHHDWVVEAVGYTSISAINGYGQVNGFELIFAGGGRHCYGNCKTGKREAFALKPHESLIRVAGRVDLARRQRGSRTDAEKTSLVSLQLATSRYREIIFGRGACLRQEGSFSFFADFNQEIVGFKLVSHAPRHDRVKKPHLVPRERYPAFS